MRSYIERAKDFVKEIYPYLERANFECWATMNIVRQYNADHTRAVKFAHGIARVALITSDYVVKFDYDEDEVACVGGGEAEMEFYAMAKAEGFAYLFAEVTRFFYGEKYFYIMPRIRGISEENYYHADHFMTDEERAWCDRHNLSDLHCNNYGFRNGKVCIVDYACSLEESYCDSETSTSSSPQPSTSFWEEAQRMIDEKVSTR